MTIPHNFNPMGRGTGGGILGYAPNVYAFWDGLNNQGVGQHDTSATTWADLSGNGNTLTRRNTSQPIIWAADGGITGANTQVSRPLENSGVMLGANFTVEVCLRKSATNFSCWWWNNRNPWVNNANGIQFATYTAKTIGCAAYDDSNTEFWVYTDTDTGTPFQTVAVTYDGSSVSWYKSGALLTASSVTIPDTVLYNTPFLVNGSYNNSAALSMRYSDGRIYAVRVYHRVLSAAELQRNAALDASRFDPNS